MTKTLIKRKKDSILGAKLKFKADEVSHVECVTQWRALSELQCRGQHSNEFLPTFLSEHTQHVFCYWLAFLPSVHIESVNWGPMNNIWPLCWLNPDQQIKTCVNKILEQEIVAVGPRLPIFENFTNTTRTSDHWSSERTFGEVFTITKAFSWWKRLLAISHLRHYANMVSGCEIGTPTQRS